jgi:excisionase family DNA binding protein
MAMLTIAQAAEKTGTKPRFVQRLVAERRIGFNRLGERHVRISDEDVDDFIQRGRVDPDGDGGPSRSD